MERANEAAEELKSREAGPSRCDPETTNIDIDARKQGIYTAWMQALRLTASVVVVNAETAGAGEI